MSTVGNACANETMSPNVSITLHEAYLENLAPSDRSSVHAKIYTRGSNFGIERPASGHVNGNFTFSGATMPLDAETAQSSEICIKIVQTGILRKKTIGKIAFRVSPALKSATALEPNELKSKSGKIVGRVTAQIVYSGQTGIFGSQTAHSNVTSDHGRRDLLKVITTSTMTSDGFPSPPPSEVSSDSSATVGSRQSTTHFIVGQAHLQFTQEEMRRLHEHRSPGPARKSDGGRPMPQTHSRRQQSQPPGRIETENSSAQPLQTEDFPLSPTNNPPAYGLTLQPNASVDDGRQNLRTQRSAPSSTANGASYFPPINNLTRQGQSDVYLHYSNGYPHMTG